MPDIISKISWFTKERGYEKLVDLMIKFFIFCLTRIDWPTTMIIIGEKKVF